MTEFACIVRRSAGLIGERGGESDGGDTGGDIRVEVGEEISVFRVVLMGDPSYESTADEVFNEMFDLGGLREELLGLCCERIRSCSGVWAKKQTRLRQPVPSLHG